MKNVKVQKKKSFKKKKNVFYFALGMSLKLVYREKDTATNAERKFKENSRAMCGKREDDY